MSEVAQLLNTVRLLHMKTKPLMYCSVLAQLAALSVFAETPTANQVMAEATSRASAEHKMIFLHFGASWCGWCHKLDEFLARPDIKPIFDNHFISVKLVVDEHDKNKVMENPGADVMLKNLGGPAGLPYYAFLNAQGSLIVSSKNHGENIGYPGAPGEIAWFIEMVKKAAPTLSEGEIKTIEAALTPPKKAGG